MATHTVGAEDSETGDKCKWDDGIREARGGGCGPHCTGTGIAPCGQT